MTYSGPPPNPHDPFGSSPYGHNPFGSPPIVSAPLPPDAHTNTYATLSVIFAFVFAPAGAVLGHLGLTQIQRSGQRGRNRALIGLILSYTFITIAVAALVIAAVTPDTPSAPATSANPTSAPTTTADQLGPITKAQLAGLLPSVDDVKRVANAPNTYTTKDIPNLAGSAGMTISPPECLPAMYGGSDQVYLNSGASATQARLFNTTGERGLTYLEERVLLFQNPTVAQQQLDKVVGMWHGCAGTTVTMVIEGNPRPSYIQMGPVRSPPGDATVFTLRNTVRGADAILTNERAIVAKANVIVDITMQGLDLGDSITAVTADILDSIPA